MTLFAFSLILSAAFIHASWNLFAKQVGGGAVFVWMAAVAGTLIYLPINFLFGTFRQVNWSWQALLFMLGSGVIQTLYFVTLQRGYRVGDLSLVYPLARGTGPMLSMIAAIALLGERPAPLAGAGAVLVVVGVFAISSTAPRWAHGLAMGRRLWPADRLLYCMLYPMGQDSSQCAAHSAPPPGHIFGGHTCAAAHARRRPALARCAAPCGAHIAGRFSA